MLPMFREAVLNGPPEIKEVAAYCIGDMIKLITNEALAPSVVHITGPLIRILGDRFNWPVKAAVLDTLSLLLSKVPLNDILQYCNLSISFHHILYSFQCFLIFLF